MLNLPQRGGQDPLLKALEAAYHRALAEGGIHVDEPNARLLLQLGLLDKSPMTDWCTPVDPRVVQRNMSNHVIHVVAKLAQQAEDLESLAETLAPAFDATQQVSGPAYEYLPTPDAANARINGLLQEVRTEVLVAQPGQRKAEQLERVMERDLEVINRGVRVCHLYPSVARRDAATREHVDAMLAAGSHVRTLTRPFAKCLIFDRTYALVTDEGDPARAEKAGPRLITDPFLVRLIAADFDRDWDTADDWASTPAVGADQIVTPTQLAILRELGAGRTQAEVCRRLGMSQSTLTTAQKDLRGELGLETNLQLACWATAEGLIPSPLTDGYKS
ncbi:hypothetical protein GCM10020367_21330 [Streptomyces sannanensis]|uniref:HTH luxR-type domain-containing protein n=1 Tax=Streptomyces sannanensis TaxID=285536 RepID=A0ABP6S971_9ACTN